MTANTNIPLATYTVSGSNLSGPTGVTFNLPAASSGYTDIVIKASIKTTAPAILLGRFNGDSATNYSTTSMGNGPGSTRSSNGADMYFSAYAHATTNWANYTWNIMNYSNSFGKKNVIMRGNNSTYGVDATLGCWNKTPEPITSVSIYLDRAESFVVGSTWTVYGIAAEAPAPKATGGAIYTDAEYYYHVFGATASFIPSQSLTADVLTIAGGGGGGGFNAGGGGGAGGHVLSTSQSFANGTTYTCTVGSGGTGGTTVGGQGNNGTNSNVTGGSLSLTAAVGGGGGGASDIGSPVYNGKSGGSGGGAGNQSYGVGGSATSGQGYAGGNGGAAAMPGGGGGAGGVGTAGSASANDAVAGGVGTTNYNIWAIATGIGQYVNGNYYIAAGGASGRGFQSAGTSVTVRAYGGGGINSQTPTIAGGLANTGSGGVGASYNSGATDWIAGAGGSGVVIVRYAK